MENHDNFEKNIRTLVQLKIMLIAIIFMLCLKIILQVILIYKEPVKEEETQKVLLIQEPLKACPCAKHHHEQMASFIRSQFFAE